MTKDLNKGISSIQYNLLNLPSRIRLNSLNMNFKYDAVGNKQETVYSYSYGSGNNSDDGNSDCREFNMFPDNVKNSYCGNIVYEEDDLSSCQAKVLTDEGYITFNGSTPQYHFYLKDHLGNNRVVLNAGGAIEQVSHYYPYGGLFGESTNGDVQRYKYNGKELDRMNGLNWYDYGARYMDGIRFTTIDPMAEKYYGVSPYVYCHNNPFNTVDPDGRDDYYTQNGEFLFRDNKDTDRIIIRNTFAEEMSKIAPAVWQKIDTPIEETVLSAEAYSNIFTNVLSQMEGDDKVIICLTIWFLLV